MSLFSSPRPFALQKFRERAGQNSRQRHIGSLAVLVVAKMALTCTLARSASTTPFLFEAKGEVSYLTDNGKQVVLERGFTAVVSNCDWMIRAAARGATGIKYFEVVYMGGTIYRYTSLDDRPGVANNATATLETRDVPPEDGSLVNFVWVGLASACYFQGRNNDQILPLWLSEKTVRAHWELSPMPPFLPESVTYFMSPGLLPPPFDKGWKAGEFRTIGFTNIGSLTIPMEFVYAQMKPKRGALSSEEVESQYQVKVLVKSLQLKPESSIRAPLTQGRTLVEERRLGPVSARLEAVQYISTNKQLPNAPEQPAIRKHRELSSVARLPSNPGSGLKRSARYVVLGILTLSAAVLMLTLWKKLSQPKE